MKIWQWLVKDRSIRLGVLPYPELCHSDKLGTSHISSRWNTRMYPRRITTPLVLHTRPMISRMHSPCGSHIELSVAAVSEDTVEFPVFLTGSTESPNTELPYVSILREPLDVIHELYPEAEQIAPLLGIIETTGTKLVITDEIPDQNALGIAYSRFISGHRERDFFTAEAIAKASDLLMRVCDKHGFKVNGHRVTRGNISISRQDCSFTIAGSFRCLTSDYLTPKDDQVVQKLLSITNKQSLDLISTLSAKDQTNILKELESPSK